LRRRGFERANIRNEPLRRCDAPSTHMPRPRGNGRSDCCDRREAKPRILRYKLHAPAHPSVICAAASEKHNSVRLLGRSETSWDPVGFCPDCTGLHALFASLRCGDVVIIHSADREIRPGGGGSLLRCSFITPRKD
jgi:hypothetical protein